MKNLYLLGVLIICITYHAKADDILPPLIKVSGTGEAKVEPTEAVVSIGVELHNKDIDELRKQVDKRASDLIAYLKKQGIAAKDIQTSSMNTYPHYPENDNSGNTNPDYYVGQKSMTFLLKKLENYDNILSGLFKLGLNRVDGVNFQVEEESKPKIEAKKKAVADAKKTAQTMAEELGVELGNVYSVSEDYTSGPVFVATAIDEEAADSTGSSVSGGQISFTSNVNVAFYIIQ